MTVLVLFELSCVYKDKKMQAATKMAAHRWIVILRFVMLVHLIGFKGIHALRAMQIRVPEAARAGSTVTLACDYDLEQAALYTIKWYRGDEEFYRFVPKESPPSRVFPMPAVNVDVSRSDSREVTLRDVQRELTGFYKCEVSADAPLFHTDIRSAYMMIADIPEEGPTISTEVRKVAIGAKVKANCTAPAAYPSVNLTWYANGEQLRPGDGVHISSSVSRYGQLFPGLESAVSRLEADARPELFRDGRLRLRCLATMFTLYRKTDETEIVEDTPRLALVVGPTQPHTTFQEGDSSGTELVVASGLHLLASVCTTALVSVAMR